MTFRFLACAGGQRCHSLREVTLGEGQIWGDMSELLEMKS